MEEFLDITPKAQRRNKKICDKLDFLEIKNILHFKIHRGGKKQKAEWLGEDTASSVFDQGHVPRIYKEILQLSDEMTT